MGRIANAMGAQPITCMGLAGAGDLIATCTSPHSRNRSFGEAFARGTSLEEYERRTHMVVEGALAACSVLEVAGRLGVEVPITRAVHAILYEGQSLDGALRALTSRHASEEFYGMDA
jgi:glycerol-3-phosphate dehydrogenase (NAD(P)+)